jgi:hypothetical protein
MTGLRFTNFRPDGLIESEYNLETMEQKSEPVMTKEKERA